MANETELQAALGSFVEVELLDAEGNREPLAFDIVREKAADFDRGLLGVNTPLAIAIRGKPVGATVAYRMGDIRQVRILSVRPSQNTTAEDITERRRDVLEEARRKAERTNSEMFASSYSGKWGDYNIDEAPADGTTG
jgi:hypothetical protein